PRTQCKTARTSQGSHSQGVKGGRILGPGNWHPVEDGGERGEVARREAPSDRNTGAERPCCRVPVRKEAAGGCPSRLLLAASRLFGSANHRTHSRKPASGHLPVEGARR